MHRLRRGERGFVQPSESAGTVSVSEDFRWCVRVLYGEVDGYCGCDEFEEINQQFTLEVRGEGVTPSPPIHIKTTNPMLTGIRIDDVGWFCVSDIVNINPVSAGGVDDGEPEDKIGSY